MDSNDSLFPAWTRELPKQWGDRMIPLPEWNEANEYRGQNGWKGTDLVHHSKAPVRVIDYYCQGSGVGTTLTGIVHFTDRAESHAGFCHGGGMCSLIDDVIGWCAFWVTGQCRPWCGYTVQINTALRKPVPVGAVLKLQAKVTRVEKSRKVYVEATLTDPSGDKTNDKRDDEIFHATGDGLVVLTEKLEGKEELGK